MLSSNGFLYQLGKKSPLKGIAMVRCIYNFEHIILASQSREYLVPSISSLLHLLRISQSASVLKVRVILSNKSANGDSLLMNLALVQNFLVVQTWFQDMCW